jgi:hypothetical protein
MFVRLPLLILTLLTVLIVPPYPDAPLCADTGEAHDRSAFHTLWNEAEGCHYDHEHGADPFTPEVAATFPGFDLGLLLGGVGVGHTNPSSPMENHHKHGGFKWNVQLLHPQGCAGFEGGLTGVNGSAIQYHAFGDANEELEGSIHSAAALLRQCRGTNPADYGYVYTVQHVNYGQRITPYQGTLIPYSNTFTPTWPTGFGPYWSIDCVDGDTDMPQCRQSLDQIKSMGLASATTATTKNTGTGERPENSTLFRLLFRSRDNYQVFAWDDFEYPFTYRWVCGDAAYDPAECDYNNTTTQVHEIAGVIPAAWDQRAGFDTDPAKGRITAEGYTTRYGTLNSACTEPGEDCHPIKLVRAFVGSYGSVLVFTPGKGTNIVPYLPERDIYFGGVPSGFVGSGN